MLILVAFYDTHELRWGYSLLPATTRGQRQSLVKHILVLRTLSHACEVWALKKSDVRKPMTAEIKFMRRTSGYGLLEHRRDGDILDERDVDSGENKFAQYK
jgi:hypothetical protein